MTPKHLYLLLVALVAIGTVAAQNEDDIPVESDNNFPPDKLSDTIDGSGDGVIEEPGETDGTTTEAVQLAIERVMQPKLLDETEATEETEGDDGCPKPCVCRIEGSSSDLIVDCSGYDLTEFPSPINSNVKKLYLRKNKLTVIPKEISSLKKLEVLNADDNLIEDLALGSVSELPALIILKLKNNKLQNYPHDLKNSFGLTKLEELDLGGNDMRTELTADTFANFAALRIIILPGRYGTELPQNLCSNSVLSKNLQEVCVESCENKTFECEAKTENKGNEDDIAVLPGMLASPDTEDNNDPNVVIPIKENDSVTDAVPEASSSEYSLRSEVDKQPNDITNTDGTTLTTGVKNNEQTETATISFRSAVNKQPSDVALNSAIIEASKDATTSDPPVKVGATTSDTKTGGVDKSIIGLVVAGMVVIVAGITIKKNWSSIKKRFSSNNRTPTTERNGTNANGTTPEEVPLQEKSPV